MYGTYVLFKLRLDIPKEDNNNTIESAILHDFWMQNSDHDSIYLSIHFCSSS